jgi:glycine cleavage system H protein
MKFPEDLRYTEKDEWIRVEGDEAVVGISDYAQDQLSDIVYVGDFPAVGDELKAGDLCAVVESVKAAADVYLPAGGTIVAVNDAASETPETLNKDPYGVGWLVRCRLSDKSELDKLMDAAAYEKYVQGREH